MGNDLPNSCRGDGFALGCAGTQKDTKEMNDRMIRCPKCGAYFSTKEELIPSGTHSVPES